MMTSIWGQVVAVVLGLCSVGGLFTAFLLDTAIMPWAVAILVSYAIWRIEQLHVKRRNTEDMYDL